MEDLLFITRNKSWQSCSTHRRRVSFRLIVKVSQCDGRLRDEEFLRADKDRAVGWQGVAGLKVDKGEWTDKGWVGCGLRAGRIGRSECRHKTQTFALSIACVGAAPSTPTAALLTNGGIPFNNSFRTAFPVTFLFAQRKEKGCPARQYVTSPLHKPIN
ncbi:hypothetical protein E2C01_071340 [Portunus trituberculatus]|uniref:Uncharacterized protein n=1 Tax=Portunus trituberculatus TaxID=210409 RepID=A0A5B7I481_PORTR|nr:hypothetical protein [Portunus trituberculatus]